MGSLQNFNDRCEKIKYLKKVYGSKVFVETGCFRGNSLSYALTLGFEKLYSCDVDQEMIDHCTNLFKDSVNLFLGTSTEFLEFTLPLLASYESVVFYLDAHLPEHDKNNGEKVIETVLNFPLKEEIKLINQYRKDKNDVIICDDLRIYEDGPFEGGNWDKRKEFEGLDLEFLSDYNYHINKYYNQEGYILLTNIAV